VLEALFVSTAVFGGLLKSRAFQTCDVNRHFSEEEEEFIFHTNVKQI